jgi:uncharacterized membrane protein
MRSTFFFALVASVAVSMSAPSPALAQEKGKDKGKQEAGHGAAKAGKTHGAAKAGKAHDAAKAGKSSRADDVVVIGGRDRRDDDRRDARSGSGPKFCRNGEGHPVHGRQWCRDKGFGLGSGSGIVWRPAGWEDVRIRNRRTGELDRGGLIDILGDVVFGRLDARRSALGVSGPLGGTWLRGESGQDVLVVRSGSLPVAEMVDRNRDGRFDVVLLNFGR